jgi:outer membrane protein insertion porin family
MIPLILKSRMSEGPQATYGRITVSGNDKTKDYVVLRELRTIPGRKIQPCRYHPYTKGIITARLFQPGKNQSEQVTPNADNGTVDINWQVEEKSADQLELSAGFGGGIGLTGTLGVTFNNFSLKNITKKSTWDPLPSGDGQRLSARFNLTVRHTGLIISLSPNHGWVAENGIHFPSVISIPNIANAYDSLGNYCKSCGDTQSYVKTVGFGISLGKQLKWPDDFFNLVYSLNFQQYKLRNYQQYIFKGLTNGTSTNISLKIALCSEILPVRIRSSQPVVQILCSVASLHCLIL